MTSGSASVKCYCKEMLLIRNLSALKMGVLLVSDSDVLRAGRQLRAGASLCLI